MCCREFRLSHGKQCESWVHMSSAATPPPPQVMLLLVILCGAGDWHSPAPLDSTLRVVTVGVDGDPKVLPWRGPFVLVTGKEDEIYLGCEPKSNQWFELFWIALFVSIECPPSSLTSSSPSLRMLISWKHPPPPRSFREQTWVLTYARPLSYTWVANSAHWRLL